MYVGCIQSLISYKTCIVFLYFANQQNDVVSAKFVGWPSYFKMTESILISLYKYSACSLVDRILLC